MSLSSAASVATLRGLTNYFDVGTRTAEPFWPNICTRVPSNGADEQHGFLGAMPGVREWLGGRVFHSLSAAEYVLKNKLWENSLAIERHHIEDDRLGMYGPLLQQLGVEAMQHPDELVMSLLNAADSTLSWDDQNFYDTDHLWADSGVQSNDLAPTAADPDAVTAAEFLTAYHAARSAMLSFKNDQGKPFIRPTLRPLKNLLLLVPPNLELVATTAITQQYLASGASNVVIDPPTIVPLAGLTATRAFQLLNVSMPLRPFIFQDRKPLMRKMKGLDDIEYKDVKFMTEARYNVGFGAWWTAVLSTFTGS